MRVSSGVLAALFLLGVAGIVMMPREVVLKSAEAPPSNESNNGSAGILPEVPENGSVTPSFLENSSTSSSVLLPKKQVGGTSDLPFQPKLQNPPTIVRGIYVTGWSAGLDSRMQSLIAFAEKANINAMVIDIKDYSGNVSYETGIPEVKAAGAEHELKILRPEALIAKLHKHNIYVIARLTVFQDPILAKAHPEWAMKDKKTGGTWKDQKGLSWMDPASKGAWDYNLAIAQNALDRGFDEINFDYVRFASDGALGNIIYSSWDGKTPKATVIKHFFEYVRTKLPEDRISADLFGLATVNHDDLGIGQVIENAYASFDFVSPMIYPSHYAPGFLGYKNPAQYPYEVIHYSMENALKRLGKLRNGNGTSTPPFPADKPLAKLRPWIQVFDLGARYDAAMIKKQTQAVEDVMAHGSSSRDFAGWLYWDPKNTYLDLK